MGCSRESVDEYILCRTASIIEADSVRDVAVGYVEFWREASSYFDYLAGQFAAVAYAAALKYLRIEDPAAVFYRPYYREALLRYYAFMCLTERRQCSNVAKLYKAPNGNVEDCLHPFAVALASGGRIRYSTLLALKSADATYAKIAMYVYRGKFAEASVLAATWPLAALCRETRNAYTPFLRRLSEAFAQLAEELKAGRVGEAAYATLFYMPPAPI